MRELRHKTTHGRPVKALRHERPRAWRLVPKSDAPTAMGLKIAPPPLVVMPDPPAPEPKHRKRVTNPQERAAHAAYLRRLYSGIVLSHGGKPVVIEPGEAIHLEFSSARAMDMFRQQVHSLNYGGTAHYRTRTCEGLILLLHRDE